MGTRARKFVKFALSFTGRGFSGSKRRKQLGVDVNYWEEESWSVRNGLAFWLKKNLPDKILGDSVLSRTSNKWEQLRRAKSYLKSRSVEDLSPEVRERLEQRRDWNKKRRKAKTVLDFFPSLQFSWSTLLPTVYRSGDVKLMLSEKGKARVADIAKSNSIWLDPICSEKILFKYRLRIQDYIDWAYKNDCVPIMVTFTTYHRWHNLDGLLKVLQRAWSDLFSGSALRKRKKIFDLVGSIRRLEITINDGDENFDENGEPKTNAGWHPHFHEIMFVKRDELNVVSDYEEQFRKEWVEAVCKRFAEVFGEEIPESFIPAFMKHGLFFSRYSKGSAKGQLRPVTDSKYMAKIMGTDPSKIFGGDKEMTTALKDSKVPFDLLCEETAANIDLWCEFAIATKGIPAFTFSHGFAKKVEEFFVSHPQYESSITAKCPEESLVATIRHEAYQILYRNGLIPQLLEHAAKGYDSFCSWVKDSFVELGIPELCDNPFAMPRPPT